MKNNSTKHSASAVTFLRALASHSPDTQLFNDPYAEQFLSPRLAKLAKSPRSHRLMSTLYQGINSLPLLNKALPYWRIMGEVLIRARYAEEILAQRVNEGLTQYVILGAGLDSFTFRRPDLMPHLKVFELDLAETQAEKLKIIHGKKLKAHKNVRYLPIDFEKSAVSDVLSASDFDPDKPTMFNWNGVSYYLSRKAVEFLFSDLSQLMGEQVEIVFDYADGRFFKTKPKTLRQKTFEGFFRSGREPLKTGFYIDELGDMLKDNGFSLIENKPGWDQEKLYPTDVFGIFPPSKLTHLAYAKGLSKALTNKQQA